MSTAKHIIAKVRALRAEYPTLCPNIIAAQLGLSVVSVRAIIEAKPRNHPPPPSRNKGGEEE